MTDTGRGAAHTGGLGSRRAPDTASISSTALFSMCCSEQKTCDQIAVRMRVYAAGSFTDAATPSPTRRTSAGEPLDTTWCFSQAGGYDSSLGRTERNLRLTVEVEQDRLKRLHSQRFQHDFLEQAKLQGHY